MLNTIFYEQFLHFIRTINRNDERITRTKPTNENWVDPLLSPKESLCGHLNGKKTFILITNDGFLIEFETLPLNGFSVANKTQLHVLWKAIILMLFRLMTELSLMPRIRRQSQPRERTYLPFFVLLSFCSSVWFHSLLVGRTSFS